MRGLPRDAKAQAGKWRDGMDEYLGASIGVIVHCEGGYLQIPSYTSATAYDKKGKKLKSWKGGANHYANFVDAVHSRRAADLTASIEDGHLSSALCHLGNVSYMRGEAAGPAKVSKIASKLRNAGDTADRFLDHLVRNGVDPEIEQPIVGPWLEIDPDTETIEGDDEANRLMTREYREPFVVPADRLMGQVGTPAKHPTRCAGALAGIRRKAPVWLSLATFTAIAAAGSLHAQSGVPDGYELVYSQDFADASAPRRLHLQRPAGVGIRRGRLARLPLELKGGSKYEPKHRSPLNIALIDDLLLADFVLEAEAWQTGREYGHRDLSLFFGFEGPNRYYYAHLATEPDDRAHNVFLVDNAGPGADGCDPGRRRRLGPRLEAGQGRTPGRRAARLLRRREAADRLDRPRSARLGPASASGRSTTPAGSVRSGIWAPGSRGAGGPRVPVVAGSARNSRPAG